MIHKIETPEQTTYFICYNEDISEITAYGIVEPTQKMGTGQPIMDTYLNEIDWQNVLLEEGIELEEENEENS